MKKSLLIIPALLAGCAINTTTETIVLDDGSKVCTWGQAGFLIPSMAGARDCAKDVVTNYATSQEDIGTVAIRSGIQAASQVWAAEIISNGLSNSGDVVNNTASGGAAVNANANFNAASASATAKSSSAAMSTIVSPRGKH